MLVVAFRLDTWHLFAGFRSRPSDDLPQLYSNNAIFHNSLCKRNLQYSRFAALGLVNYFCRSRVPPRPRLLAMVQACLGEKSSQQIGNEPYFHANGGVVTVPGRQISSLSSFQSSHGKRGNHDSSHTKLSEQGMSRVDIIVNTNLMPAMSKALFVMSLSLPSSPLKCIVTGRTCTNTSRSTRLGSHYTSSDSQQ
jgi:hypothetical protein